MRLGVEAALVHGELVPGDVSVEDGRVGEVGLAGGSHGLIAIPGLVDIQNNGYGGVDFISASTEDYRGVGEALTATLSSPRSPRADTAARPARARSAP